MQSSPLTIFYQLAIRMHIIMQNNSDEFCNFPLLISKVSDSLIPILLNFLDSLPSINPLLWFAYTSDTTLRAGPQKRRRFVINVRENLQT
jgi:hypothetical protein